MTRAELKSMAKEQLKGKLGTLILILLLVSGIIWVLNMIPVVGAIITFIITPTFSLAVSMIYLKITKKEDIEVADLFKGFNKTGKALWLSILNSFFIFLWSLLLVIPGIIKSYAYSMAYYVLADNPELTARQALSRSKQIMKGHKAELFVIHLSFFWWYLLVGITCGFAIFYVGPYMSTTVANFYNSIKEG